MNFVIYNNEEYEEEKALFDLNTNKVILKGDYFSDKIEDKINGYIKALADFSIYTGDIETEWIDKDHERFHEVGFSYEEE